MRLFFCLALSICSVSFAQVPDLTALDIVERHTPDGPVALVDGSPVEKEAFLQLYNARMEVLKKQLPSINDAIRIKTGYQSIGDLVKREILYVEAKKQGVKVPDAEVEKRFQDGLKAQQQHAKEAGMDVITEAELLSESGKSKAELLEGVRKSIMVEKMEEQIALKEGAAPTQAEIKEFYESRPGLFRKAGGFHLQQVFVQPKPTAAEASEAEWEKARKAVEKALARIKAGESFESVANDTSESKDRKNGGDMGTLPENELPDFVVAAVRTMKTGDMSPVIKSSFGYHIFKLLGTEKEQTVSLADATPKIKEAILKAKSVNSVDAFCVKAMQDTDRVVIYLKLEKAIATLSQEELKMLAPDNGPAN